MGRNTCVLRETEFVMRDDCVSVVLPYFNRADTLARAACSVLDQTHRDLRLYLINDGSTDGSREVARRLDDDRIEHIELAGNGGVSAARNAGLARATTALVAFMDSDDAWLPEKLALQVNSLRNWQQRDGRVAVLGCGWRYLEQSNPPGSFPAGPFTRHDVLANRAAGIGTPMLLVDRAIADRAAEFDPLMPALVDREYVMACLANGARLAVVPEILAVVTRGRTDHVANPGNAAVAFERLLQKYASDLAQDPALRSWYHFRACREHLIRGATRSALPHVLGALAERRLRRLLHLASGLFGRSTGLALAQKIASP